MTKTIGHIYRHIVHDKGNYVCESFKRIKFV